MALEGRLGMPDRGDQPAQLVDHRDQLTRADAHAGLEALEVGTQALAGIARARVDGLPVDPAEAGLLQELLEQEQHREQRALLLLLQRAFGSRLGIGPGETFPGEAERDLANAERADRGEVAHALDQRPVVHRQPEELLERRQRHHVHAVGAGRVARDDLEPSPVVQPQPRLEQERRGERRHDPGLGIGRGPLLQGEKTAIGGQAALAHLMTACRIGRRAYPKSTKIWLTRAACQPGVPAP